MNPRRPPPINWEHLQALGSGSLRIVEEKGYGRWAIELDGVRRSYRSHRARAARDAQAIYLALAPDGGCPVCLRPVAANANGRLPVHFRPKVHAEKGEPCPGAGRFPVGAGEVSNG